MLINEECESSLSGLYAAGEAAGGGSLSRAAVEGLRAGVNAARYATEVGEGALGMAQDQVLETHQRLQDLYSPLPGVHYKELEEATRHIMADHVGIVKNEAGVASGMSELEKLSGQARLVRAKNSHEVLRSVEAQNLLEFSLCMTEATLHRIQTRAGAGTASGEFFWSSEYPEDAFPEDRKMVTVQRSNGKRVVQLEPVPA